MSDEHGHGEGHEHAGMLEGDAEADYYPTRLRAIEALLIEKGICSLDELENAVDQGDSRSAADGARVVARAWANPGFKMRLLSDPMNAIKELGYDIPDNMPKLTVVENTEQVHNIIVCTLCSCYPRALLGRPPDWYKSLAYRSRAVIDPRGIMREFGLDLDDSVEVRVQDSSADMRYLVLPRRPSGTEALSETELAKLITRDSMIGVCNARTPEAATVS
ncbi:nitrile hydratase subunit alpha [Dehalococcoidia bacterium]|nr:nitrile hydratase subunit alpha [Dehalococcoidia bacterium]